MNALSGGAILLDLRPSMTFRKAHVAGAQWACRPRLAEMAPDLSGAHVLLLAEDPVKAAWTAQDLQEAGLGDVAVVAGGHDALVKAGAAIIATPDHPSDAECIDHLFFVHDRHDGNLEASRRYLEWETGLIAQLSDVERAEYKLLHP
jgi:rhodanese-related sulfurtransferase